MHPDPLLRCFANLILDHLCKTSGLIPNIPIGIVGSGERKKFGVTGDTVNTGSRVEGLNKEFSTSILITRETLEAVDGKFKVRSCGEVKVKGREKPVEVFEVLRPETSL